MPFAASEIVWDEGGRLKGFINIEAHHFTLRNSFVPRLVCDEYPDGMPETEAQNRFIIHQFKKKPDPAPEEPAEEPAPEPEEPAETEEPAAVGEETK